MTSASLCPPLCSPLLAQCCVWCVLWILCAILGIPESARGSADATDARRLPDPEDADGLRRGPPSAPDQVGETPGDRFGAENASVAANSNAKTGVKVRDRPSHSWRSFPPEGNRE